MALEIYIFQDRSKISRVHMSETVEELKKFNARRKLKVRKICIFNANFFILGRCPML